jgi:hypothetical protein
LAKCGGDGVQGRWPVIFTGFAIVCLFAEPVQPAQPPDRAVETETITAPRDSLGVSDPDLIAPDRQELDEAPPEGGPVDDGPAAGEISEPGELPEILYDTDKLPPPVRRLREQIIEAALTGDIEKLRPVFEANEGPPAISSADTDDPIDALRSLSGDPGGREILAIMIEVLDAGYVHVDIGTPEEMYIWPYFARYPLDELDGPQMVELFKLLTAGDYEDMKIFGIYLFYRVGIDPKGIWRYFLAGD